jgi:hypothetical protein
MCENLWSKLLQKNFRGKREKVSRKKLRKKEKNADSASPVRPPPREVGARRGLPTAAAAPPWSSARPPLLPLELGEAAAIHSQLTEAAALQLE